MTDPTRPILRWHGGKWVLAPWIISHFGPHRIYTEAYGGAASVLLRKPPAYAEIYNDLDGDVVNLFRVCRSSRREELLSMLRMTPFAREEFQAAYGPSDDPVERAWALIVRSFMGFGSNGHNKATGFRANSNRSGTTPAHDWVNYPQALAAICDRILAEGVTIENRPALEVIMAHDSPETLHYVDPPYAKSTRTDAGDDYAFEMTDDDHAQLLASLRSVEGMVVLSGYRCALYDELIGDWFRVDRAALADGAAKRTESIWLNAAAVAAKGQGCMLDAMTHD
jgi:DNA adenine methylase